MIGAVFYIFLTSALIPDEILPRCGFSLRHPNSQFAPYRLAELIRILGIDGHLTAREIQMKINQPDIRLASVHTTLQLAMKQDLVTKDKTNPRAILFALSREGRRVFENFFVSTEPFEERLLISDSNLLRATDEVLLAIGINGQSASHRDLFEILNERYSFASLARYTLRLEAVGLIERVPQSTRIHFRLTWRGEIYVRELIDFFWPVKQPG